MFFVTSFPFLSTYCRNLLLLLKQQQPQQSEQQPQQQRLQQAAGDGPVGEQEVHSNRSYKPAS